LSLPFKLEYIIPEVLVSTTIFSLDQHTISASMESIVREQQSPHLLSVETLLAFEGIGDSNKPPLTGSAAASKTGGLMSPPPQPDQGQVRPLSFSSRPNNRLSLSLPIQAADRDFYNSTRLTPTSSDPSTRQASPAADVVPSLSPNDSGSFLVALAAQERRVLELKEELSRAESELKKLKRRWAVHEASRTVVRSRVETKNVELRTIQPMGSGMNGMSADNEEEIPIKRSLEFDRRKAILAGVNKDSRRKVITGGHTRALSLLSPVQSSHHQGLEPLSAVNAESKDIVSPTLTRDTSQESSQVSTGKVRHSYQDSATSGVKQIAEDIKLGLWSFMEDLRQATVGDEAVTGMSVVEAKTTQHVPGKKSGRCSPAGDLHRGQSQSKLAPKTRGTKNAASAAPPPPPEAGEEATKDSGLGAQTPKTSKTRLYVASSLDDDWSHWDSPVSNGGSGRWSNSTALSSQCDGNSVRSEHNSP
jgi:hypothetical protein